MSLTQNVLCTVVGIQNNPVAAGVPATAGEVLTWNGSAWQAGGNAFFSGTTSLVGAVITGGTLTVTGNIMPASNNTANIGAAITQFANIYCVTLNQSSDPRLKKDIQKIPGALALVMSIPPKTYRFKTEPADGPVHWGFLTTDVEEVMGKSFAGVRTDVQDNPDKIQTLSYTEMIAILWRAVQELSDEVAELHEQSRTIRSAQSN